MIICYQRTGSSSSLGIGFLEVGIARWKSNKSLKKIVKVEGIEYLKEAEQKDKGVILMSAHFTLLEITALIAREGITENLPPLVGMYRVGSNPIINRFFRTMRLKSVESLVTKFEIKGLIRALKDKKIVWYASDQSFAGKNAVEVDFFGQQASTTSAISFNTQNNITGCTDDSRIRQLARILIINLDATVWSALQSKSPILP